MGDELPAAMTWVVYGPKWVSIGRAHRAARGSPMSNIEWIFGVWLLLNTISTALLTASLRSVARRPNQRDARIAALEADLEDVLHRIRKLTGQLGRQKQLEQPAATDEDGPAQRPGESAIDWKRRVRMLVAQGKVKHEV